VWGGLALLESAAVLPRNACALDVEVYQNDFDTPPTVVAPAYGGLSGFTGTEPAQGFAGRGNPGNVVSGNILHNATGNNFTNTPSVKTTLILNGLEPHTGIKLRFIAGIVDTWDGDGDFFNVDVDNVSVFRESFRNPVTPDHPQSYIPPPGVLVASDENMFFESSLDALYDLGADAARFGNIPHTGSTLRLDFYADGWNWNRPANESWAMDNLSVTLVNFTPEPTAAMLMVAPVWLALHRRRRWHRLQHLQRLLQPRVCAVRDDRRVGLPARQRLPYRWRYLPERHRLLRQRPESADIGKERAMRA
jgi:hypothetical protein